MATRTGSEELGQSVTVEVSPGKSRTPTAEERRQQERSVKALNHSELARTLGLPVSSLKRYLALLEALFLVRLVLAWATNRGKRLVCAQVPSRRYGRSPGQGRTRHRGTRARADVLGVGPRVLRGG